MKTINRFKMQVVVWATLVVVSAAASAAQLTEQQKNMLARHAEEFSTYPLMREWSQRHKPESLAIVGVNVMPMDHKEVLANHTVLVKDSVITAIMPADEAIIPEGVRIIRPGDNHWLIPGLTEAHSHTQFSLSQFLVYLTRGITTLREMDGFDWMLRARQQAANHELLIPNLYVTGHILSNRAWDFFMTQVDTAEQVQAEIRKQAQAGYDFIKIHNSMPEPLYSAVFDEAARHDLDVVGHIPQEISIAQAVAAGQQTNEHFKGYIFDGDLTITEEDYVAATKGSDMWHVPTFANYHEHLRGPAAVELAVQENSLRLVPSWMRSSWSRQAAMPEDDVTRLRQGIFTHSKTLFGELIKVTDRFVAGTDTGGYAYQVPGYSLLEEVRIFESLGLSPFDALKTATINAAQAMRKESVMGTLAPAKRADMVLLGRNPLESSQHLSDIRGVMIRGAWLDQQALESIEKELESRFADEADWKQGSDREKLARIISIRDSLMEDGFVIPDYLLNEVNGLAAQLNIAQDDISP